MNIGIRGAVGMVVLMLAGAVPARAQDELDRMIGRPVAVIQFEIEGKIVMSPQLESMVPIHVGDPLRLESVRDAEARLTGAGRYDDVQVLENESPSGIVLIFRLTARHPVDKVEFTGDTGLGAGDLTNLITERYGGVPSREQPEAVAEVLANLLNDEGFPDARVQPRLEETHNPDRATLILEVQAGARARIVRTIVTGTSPLSAQTIVSRTQTAAGQPFRPSALEAALAALGDDLRKQGYYTAEAALAADPVRSDAEGGLIVTLSVNAGPRVTIAWDGPKPPGDEDDYVPMRRQGSVDEDLLEDSDRRVADYWKGQGYKDVTVTHTRVQGDPLVVTMHTQLGVRYRIEALKISGNEHVPEATFREVLQVRPGDPYEASRIAAGITRLRVTYLRLGYSSVVTKEPALEEVPGSRTPTDVRLVLHLEVVEGPQLRIGSVTFSGVQPQREQVLRELARSRQGELYVVENLLRDKADLETAYRDRGFADAEVGIKPLPKSEGRTVDVEVTVNEGPQIMIAGISVVGNRRVSAQAILSQITLREGQPYGEADRRESQRSLQNMGVFRQVTIEEEPRATGETLAHVIVTVDELPATSISYGGGVESHRFPITASFKVVDRLRVVPRGFFGITRRNLWGKNRSVDFFSRVAPGFPDTEGNSFGFTEYRASGTYREPRLFNTEADALLSVTSEQVHQTDFNFARKSLNAGLQRRLSPEVSVSGRYALESTRVFDSSIKPSDQLTIDRVLPQVRLSLFGGGVVWDRRNDPVNPTRGTLSTADGEMAARHLGSEIGYAKMFLQESAFYAVPSARRLVLAGRAEVGVARGFERQVTDASGQVQTVADLPASQRFYAGGGTSVRGFLQDRLGVPSLLTTNGLSVGGNGVVVLNAEIRATLGKLLGREFGIVVFTDAGNVFAKASDIDLSELRAAYGFGMRYNSPLGPLRLDFGFKTHPEVIGGSLEHGWEYHLNIGEAF